MNEIICKLPHSRVLSEKSYGEEYARQFMLDKIDFNYFRVILEIQEDTWSITDSFIIGLLEPLYFRINNKELFLKRVVFSLPENGIKISEISHLIDRLEYQLEMHKTSHDLKEIKLGKVSKKNNIFILHRVVKESCGFYYPEYSLIFIPIWFRYNDSDGCMVSYNTLQAAEGFFKSKQSPKPNNKREIFKVNF